MTYDPDNANAPGWPHTPGPPDIYIGNGRKFPITIQPTTVSFYRTEFRENKPGESWEWPDDSSDSAPAGQPEFSVAENNNEASDTSATGTDIYLRLYDGDSYVAFSHDIRIPLEYKNQSGTWTQFKSGSQNKHTFLYTAAGGCALRPTCNNTQESDYRGPWQSY